MTDRPIIFSGPMVRALIEGRKTQTRRVLKPQPRHGRDTWHGDAEECWTEGKCALCDGPPYAIGDRLWVRETWLHTGTGVWTVEDVPRALDGGIIYRADDNADPGAKWFPSIFMPRRASRLTLTVTDVKVERLQEISEVDAEAEGMARPRLPHWPTRPYGSAFRETWNTIHNGKPQHFWSANPWVVALTFTVEQRNIDG